MKKYFVAGFIFLFANVQPVSADVFINEVLPNPKGEEKSDEWLELFNSGSEEVDVSGFVLSDLSNHKLTISADYVEGGETKISPNGYLVVRRNNHPTFSLNNTDEEIIKLSDSSGNLIDEFIYEDSVEEASWGRIPDGGEIAGSVLSASSNSQNLITPTNIPTEIPTLTPKATSTPVARSTSTPKSPTPSPKVLLQNNPNEDDPPKVLADVNYYESQPAAEIDEKAFEINRIDDKNNFKNATETKKIPVFAILLIITGIGVFLLSASLFLKKKKIYDE